MQIVSGGEQDAVMGGIEVDECRKKQEGSSSPYVLDRHKNM